MIHYFSLYQATHWLSFEDIFVFFCRHDSSIDSAHLQYIIILEAGRWPICFQVIMFNVYFLMSDEGNFVCRHVEQIRTASRDGDRTVGVKPDCRCGTSSISIEPDQPVSKMFSWKGIIVIQISIAQINLINMIHCIHQFELGFIFIKDK